MPPDALTALFFVGSGFIASTLGQYWLGLVSVLYGLVDCFLDECESARHATAAACSAGVLYDVGALHFADTFLQRLVTLFSITAFLFKHGLVRAVVRSFLTAVAFAVTSSERISPNQATVIYFGVYLGLLCVSKLTGQQPQRTALWVGASAFASAAGFAFRELALLTWPGTKAREWAVSAAHVAFAADVVFVALALYCAPKEKKTI